MANAINLATDRRAERKLLIHVVEWDASKYGGPKNARERIGKRVEDSSIEMNNEVNQTPDITGKVWTDVDQMQPTQSFDTFAVLGGSDLASYLTQASLLRDKEAFNNVFTVYTITAFIGETSHYCVKEVNCTIEPQSMGGDSHVLLPIQVYYSNDVTEGTVNTGTDGKFDIDFEFTEKSSSSSAFTGD